MGDYSHVSGIYNCTDGYYYWSEWVAGTSYNIGDKVKITTVNNDTTTVVGYICKTANSDSSFNSSKWISRGNQMNYAEIVGNGTYSVPSNARALDWEGNEYLMGELYVKCQGSSMNGIKLANIPDPPSTDGTYTLQATVSSGVITYIWVAGA